MRYFHHPESCCVWEADELTATDGLVEEIDHNTYLILKREYSMPTPTNTRRGATTGRTGFTYQPRQAANTAERINKYRTGGKDSFLEGSVNTITPKVGDNWFRILPPTWDDPQHYAYDLYFHYEVGPDNNSYLCVEKMRGEQCGLCDELRRAKAAGAVEYARALESSLRLAAWVLNRDEENKGPQLWLYSPMMDKEILEQSRDRRTGEVLMIDHPETGYDVEFTRTGTGLTTKYSGFKLSRQPSAVSATHIDFVVQNPIPTLLKFYPLDHIMTSFGGSATPTAAAGRPVRPSQQGPMDGPPDESDPPFEKKTDTAAEQRMHPPLDEKPAQPAAAGRTSGTQPNAATTPKAATPVAGNARRRAVAPTTPKGPDFSGMDINALLDWADNHNIVVPDDVADESIAQYLSEQAAAAGITA